MSKEELAETFVMDKADCIKALIKEAFYKGYEQGVLQTSLCVNMDGIEFVDLGLPSGTLWSSCPLWHCNYGYKLTLFSHVEAEKLSIPDVQQWQELLNYCLFKDDMIISPNGMRIGYSWAPNGHYKMYNLGEECQEANNMFWLKGDPDSDFLAPTMVFDNNVNGTNKHFSGYKLPVFLVKEKTDL